VLEYIQVKLNQRGDGKMYLIHLGDCDGDEFYEIYKIGHVKIYEMYNEINQVKFQITVTSIRTNR
jgi:hypothetical protein